MLQEQEFERLGSGKTIKVDVRLVAATHRNLAKMVAEGKFRSDLFYRLHVFPIPIPPLRERPEDIPDLVRHFVRLFARRFGKKIEVIPTRDDGGAASGTRGRGTSANWSTSSSGR